MPPALLPPNVVPWDGPLRYKVRSKSRDKTYFVQIDSYKWNGECQCEFFTFELQKILKQGISPVEAVRQKLVVVKDWQRIPANSLKCQHIMDASEQFLRDFGEEVDKRRRENRTPRDE